MTLHKLSTGRLTGQRPAFPATVQRGRARPTRGRRSSQTRAACRGGIWQGGRGAEMMSHRGPDRQEQLEYRPSTVQSVRERWRAGVAGGPWEAPARCGRPHRAREGVMLSKGQPCGGLWAWNPGVPGRSAGQVPVCGRQVSLLLCPARLSADLLFACYFY